MAVCGKGCYNYCFGNARGDIGRDTGVFKSPEGIGFQKEIKRLH
jgi:hypothetical protein